MKIKLLSIAFLLGSLIMGCKKDETNSLREPKQFNLPVKATAIISKSNSFGIDLLKKVAKVDDGNIMLSPLSASAALTMLLNGSNSVTYTQIQQMLGFEGMTAVEINESYKSLVKQLLEADPQVKLAIANAIWYRQDFQVKPPFLATMSTDFSAHVEALDFALPSALNTMNKWASDNTFGKIPKVLNEISADAVMFLMNAVYFKGTWTYEFDKNQTTPGRFTLINNTPIEVSTMHGGINAKAYFESDYNAIELSYGRTNYSMIVIVPNANFENFVNEYNNTKWNALSQYLDNNAVIQTYNVYLPKFKFSFEKVLNDQLIELGMIDAFVPDLANLTNISDESIVVSFVKQNTFVEVNEEGTEAAAVTTIGIVVTSTGPSQVPSFIVDKPFIFAIRERTTNTILFMGKVVDPSL